MYLAVVVPFVDYWSELFYLNETFTNALHEAQDECNYTSYLDKYLTFPPPEEPFPVLEGPTEENNGSCSLFDAVSTAEMLVNPCFDIYHITATCPVSCSSIQDTPFLAITVWNVLSK